MTTITVKVKDAHNTYTARALGIAASATGGAQHAVERLADKLFGPLQRVKVTRADDGSLYARQEWSIDTDGTQACRVCGCTYDKACPDGCYWVESDLCSSCADEARPQ